MTQDTLLKKDGQVGPKTWNGNGLELKNTPTSVHSGKHVYIPIHNSQGKNKNKKKPCIWGKKGQKETELTKNRQEQA